MNGTARAGAPRGACVLAALGCLAAQPTQAAAPEDSAAGMFDREALRRRGLDPALADVFRDGPRFAPGAADVSVVINGQAPRRATLWFDDQGRIELDAAALAALQLRRPAGTSCDAPHRCALDQLWPLALVQIEPAQQRVLVQVPAQALERQATDNLAVERGGRAAMLNYDFSVGHLRAPTGTQSTYSGFTTMGFNASGWVFRSRQSIGDAQHLRWLDTQLERSLPTRGMRVQLGELTSANPLFPSASVTGVQLMPESALRTAAGAASAVVDGVTAGPAWVEVHQRGVLLLRARVEGGAFSLGDISPRDSGADLQVTVIEDGGRRQYSLSPTQYQRAAMALPGATLTVGRQRLPGRPDRGQVPTLVAVSQAWKVLAGRAVFSAGAAVHDHYRAAAFGLDMGRGRTSVTSLRTSWGRQARTGAVGLRSAAQWSTRRAALSLHVGATHRTAGFRELHEVAPDEAADGVSRSSQWQVSLGAGVASARWGTFHAAYAPWQQADGLRSARVTASWARALGGGQLLLTLERGGAGSGGAPHRLAALSLSLPLQRHHVRGTTRVRDGQARTGVEVSARTSSDGDWRASAEQDHARGGTRLAAGFNAPSRHAQLGGSVSYGDGWGQGTAQLGGGLVVHRTGLTFSPHRIADTFGIVSTGRQPSVRVQTDAGTVWTNRRGHAVVPALSPHRPVHLQVDGRSLPRQVDLVNGSREVRAARGAVARAEFALVTTRRVLLRVLDAAGAVVEKGTSVMEDGRYLTTVVDDGRAFLTDYQPSRTLQIVSPDGTTCRLRPELGSPPAPDSFFEAATVRCEPE